MDPAAHVHVVPITKPVHVNMSLLVVLVTVTLSIVPFGRCVAPPLGVVLRAVMVPVGALSVMLGASHVPPTQMSPLLPQLVDVMHSTQTAGLPERSHIGVPSVQPASSPVPGVLSMHTTHSGAPTLPLHTPPAHGRPASTGGLEHVPRTHRSVVQGFPSKQSVGSRQPTQANPPMPSLVHCGAPAVQPRSWPMPAAVSMHVTHEGFIAAPSHTPPGHVTPAMSEVFTHTLARHVSVEHALPSLQCASVMHARHTPMASQ